MRLDHALVPVIDRAVIVESAAALVLPGAGDGGDAARRMHVDRAVALSAKSRSRAGKKRASFAPTSRANSSIVSDRAAGDRARPIPASASQMRLEFARHVGVAVEIVAVGIAVAEQAMHDRAGERAVGAGPDQHRQIGLLHRAVHVDVDGDDLGAALLAGAHRMRHHIDLGGDRIGAPDHHADRTSPSRADRRRRACRCRRYSRSRPG